MVFSGKPSKACQRCRTRRLKCDLRSPCGQCIRASTLCSGYSHINGLRIRDQTHSVHLKALSKTKKNVSVTLPEKPHYRYMPLSLDSRALDAFFKNYVSGPAKTWDFLLPFYASSPEYLTLALEAVSQAYLSHTVSSTAALTISRERYVGALRLLNTVIQDPKTLTKDTTTIVLTTLLLDLYEKITTTPNPSNPRTPSSSWSSHVQGALTLVQLRGLQDFKSKSNLRILIRLTTNFLISCVATNSPVPEQLVRTREHVVAYSNLNIANDPKWRMSDLMILYTNLWCKISRSELSAEIAFRKCLELDGKFGELVRSMPREWLYERIPIEHKMDDGGVYGDYFDIYPEIHITQVWNVVRLVRILLNELIVSFCSSSPSAAFTARENIQLAAQDICASAPQYLGLGLSTSASDSASKVQDAYPLILPLYVAAAAQTVFASEGVGEERKGEGEMKGWIVKQLTLMSSSYGIRNAEVVCSILREGRERAVSPWSVYVMLGSYAFAA